VRNMRSVVFLLGFGIVAYGCAGGSNTPPGDGGGGPDTGTDTGTGDSGTGDAGTDALVDATTADADATVITRVGTCEACTTDDECQVGSSCVTLSVGGKACLPWCTLETPVCPAGLTCGVDITSGTDQALCFPIGGPCCLDEDADTYGQGIGCPGTDCDDANPDVNPAMDEICDGLDNNCDSAVDEGGTDCSTGRCTAQGDGTYAAIESATCFEAACVSGTLTACGDYACSEGGEVGIACATSCTDAAGADNDNLCADAAHCDAGVCIPDEPNGGVCDEDTDCGSVHCDSGYCCTSGACCASDTDCMGVAASCTDTATCQGERGDASCMDNTCTVLAGVADDTPCDSSTLALDCGLFQPIFCTGAADQTAPACPTTCTLDAECTSDAHCEGGTCVIDRGAGGLCSRDGHCSMGLSCTDAVCCTTPCDGTCEYCDASGACVPVASGTDPDAECLGFSCASYYDGFSGVETTCYQRADVAADESVCSGARSCRSPAEVCPTQPRGAVQADCDIVCQSPTPGSCVGTIPGDCTNLDDPGTRDPCGVGECWRDVQRCIGGVQQSCVPGAAAPELCDNLFLDEDCDGVVDNGFNDTRGATCGGETVLPTLSGGGATADSGLRRIYVSGNQHVYAIQFTNTLAQGDGVPTVSFSVNQNNAYVFDVGYTCGPADAPCGAGMPTDLTSYSFVDDADATGTYNTRATAWPDWLYITVRRPTGQPCDRYNLRVAR